MKERPILFNAAMVRAILDGSKTQTRRIVSKQFANDAVPAEVPATSPEGWQISGHSGLWWDDAGACIDDAIRCPYGLPGDRIWVREAFRFLNAFDSDSPATVGDRCLDAGYPKPWAPTCYEADGWLDNWMHVGTPPHDGLPMAGKLRPGIHMPRWASRISLEITGIRVERLQDISEDDAQSEGPPKNFNSWRDNFCALWQQINGYGSWDANPWVWVVEFKRVQP